MSIVAKNVALGSRRTSITSEIVLEVSAAARSAIRRYLTPLSFA